MMDTVAFVNFGTSKIMAVFVFIVGHFLCIELAGQNVQQFL